MIFFYLDAHSDNDYPILDEIDFVLKNFENFVILIDDFEVPNDSDYGYDSFKGRKLNLRLIKNLLTNNLSIFFPHIPGIRETGRLRGYVIISNNIEAVDFMKSIEELSIFDANK